MGMISPPLESIDDLGPYLDSHIQKDLQQVAECYEQSTDNCMILLHNLINCIKQSKEIMNLADSKVENEAI